MMNGEKSNLSFMYGVMYAGNEGRPEYFLLFIKDNLVAL